MDIIEQIASALQNADLHDGDEGNHYRLFDLLDFSGENKSVMITRQLAIAAHSVIAGKVAELEKALRMVHSYVADALDSVPALDAIVALDAISDVVEAALAPYPERR